MPIVCRYGLAKHFCAIEHGPSRTMSRAMAMTMTLALHNHLALEGAIPPL